MFIFCFMLSGFEDENKIPAVQKYQNAGAARVTGITYVHERCQVGKQLQDNLLSMGFVPEDKIKDNKQQHQHQQCQERKMAFPLWHPSRKFPPAAYLFHNVRFKF